MSDNNILVPDVGSDSEVEVIEILISEGDNIAIDVERRGAKNCQQCQK